MSARKEQLGEKKKKNIVSSSKIQKIPITNSNSKKKNVRIGRRTFQKLTFPMYLDDLINVQMYTLFVIQFHCHPVWKT